MKSYYSVLLSCKAKHDKFLFFNLIKIITNLIKAGLMKFYVFRWIKFCFLFNQSELSFMYKFLFVQNILKLAGS